MSKLRNLGSVSIQMLATAGIQTEELLRALGSVAAYRAVQAVGCRPSLNLLWALEGALTDRDWKQVSKEERTSLILQLDDAQRLV